MAAGYKLQSRKSTAWAEPIIEKSLKPFFGSMPASNLNAAAIEQYVRHRQEPGRAPATIGNDLAILRRALNLALRAGKIGQWNPKPAEPGTQPQSDSEKLAHYRHTRGRKAVQ